MHSRHSPALKLSASHLTSQPEQWLSEAEYESFLAAPKQAQLLVGQARALQALEESLQSLSPYSHAYLSLPVGFIVNDVIQALGKTPRLQKLPAWQAQQQFDWVYAANPEDSLNPLCVWLPKNTAKLAIQGLVQYLQVDPQTEPHERHRILETLERDYPSTSFSQYLKRLQNKAFEDLPGNELATILVSHHRQGTPWVYCDEVTETSLFGAIHTQAIEGTVSSELHLIKAGALHKANGGVLFIDAADLLQHPKLWRRLKTSLKRQALHWSLPNKGESALFYEPEPIPLQVKVVLVGSSTLFSQLNELDLEFSNYFPYFADFTLYYIPQGKSFQGKIPQSKSFQGKAPQDKFPEHKSSEDKLPESKNSIIDYLSFLTALRDQIGHRPLSYPGMLALLRYTSYLCEHQKELSLDSVRILQFLEEVERFAKQAKSLLIEADHVYLAEQSQRARFAQHAELSWQSILEEQVYIATTGQSVGQINGLTVVSHGGLEFGEPSRITASVQAGDGEIIDIERKSELSGSIHTKGVMILSAYFARLFAQKEPLPLSASLVFEQSYHEVDGDSASLAELCCLLSAFSDLPIEQGIAVTGAIDQFGRVQAVGGINEKIEGYFEICKFRGLTGTQGVILPTANQLNLHLPQEILQAVEAGQFHLYAVKHVSEAVELLMDVPYGTENTENKENTLLGRIALRLQSMHGHEPFKPSFIERLRHLFQK